MSNFTVETKVFLFLLISKIREEIVSKTERVSLTAHISQAILLVNNLASSVIIGLLLSESRGVTNILVPASDIGGEGRIISKLSLHTF